LFHSGRLLGELALNSKEIGSYFDISRTTFSVTPICQKNGNTYNRKVFASKKIKGPKQDATKGPKQDATKGPKQDIQNLQWLPMLEGN
jgi:hypothetical protein